MTRAQRESIVCTLHPGSNEIGNMLYPELDLPEAQPGKPNPAWLELMSRPPDVTVIALHESDVFSVYMPRKSGGWEYRGYCGKVSPIMSDKPAVRHEGYRQLVSVIEHALGKTALKIALV